MGICFSNVNGLASCGLGWVCDLTGERARGRGLSPERPEFPIFPDLWNLAVEVPHGTKHHNSVGARLVQGAPDIQQKQPSLGVCTPGPIWPRGNEFAFIINCEPTQASCPAGKQVGECRLVRGICLSLPFHSTSI